MYWYVKIDINSSSISTSWSSLPSSCPPSHHLYHHHHHHGQSNNINISIPWIIETWIIIYNVLLSWSWSLPLPITTANITTTTTTTSYYSSGSTNIPIILRIAVAPVIGTTPQLICDPGRSFCCNGFSIHTVTNKSIGLFETLQIYRDHEFIGILTRSQNGCDIRGPNKTGYFTYTYTYDYANLSLSPRLLSPTLLTSTNFD